MKKFKKKTIIKLDLRAGSSFGEGEGNKQKVEDNLRKRKLEFITRMHNKSNGVDERISQCKEAKCE